MMEVFQNLFGDDNDNDNDNVKPQEEVIKS
jgi:hypothetical protein